MVGACPGILKAYTYLLASTYVSKIQVFKYWEHCLMWKCVGSNGQFSPNLLSGQINKTFGHIRWIKQSVRYDPHVFEVFQRFTIEN